MKKIYFVLVSLLLFITSCNDDFLTRIPLDAYSDASLWKSESDVTSVLNGCYKDWYSEDNIVHMDCASDNAYNPYPWEGYQALGNGTALATDADLNGTTYWNYKVIYKCNVCLENVDRAKDNVSASFIARAKAEVRFLRAFRYFLMERAYGDVALVTKPITVEEANSIARTPASQIQKFILDELTEISQSGVLPTSYSGKDVGRITRGAALALKARYELYLAKYADCVATSNEIMSLGYDLFPNYVDLFRVQNENNQEVILDIQFMENDYPNGSLGIMPPGSIGGWCSINPNQSLVDNYECLNGKTIDDPSSGYNPDDPYVNRDPRLEATIIRPGSLYEGMYYDPITPGGADNYAPYGGSKTGYLVKKFTSDLSDWPDMWAAPLNMIVIRYAEVLLNYAEAKIELNQMDESVYDAINKVRTRVGLPQVDKSVYNDQAKMRELVRRERRSELAMEGLRWYDVQRWKIGNQTMSGTLYGSRLGTVDPTTGRVTYSNDKILVEQRMFDESKNYLWPVPQKEIDADPNLKPNNSGY